MYGPAQMQAPEDEQDRHTRAETGYTGEHKPRHRCGQEPGRWGPRQESHHSDGIKEQALTSLLHHKGISLKGMRYSLKSLFLPLHFRK